MEQYTFIVCFIISLIIVFINCSIHKEKFNNDNFNLYELIHRRKSLTFTTTQRQVQNQVLKAHNTYRSRHCVPPLKLDDDISRSAQKYADHLANTDQLEHNDALNFGENIFKVASTYKIDNFDGAEATRSWYDEIKSYDFKNPKFSEETGHFTQVMWKETVKIGVGYATGKHNSQYTLYVVAQYSPAGNVNDYFSENVLSPTC